MCYNYTNHNNGGSKLSTIGIIAEYNPFHLGHKYHLELSKKITNSRYSIAVISGSFVQRGEPSLIDKWTKARMAIDNGIDLVIELPFIFSVQSAELFAYGGISLLNSLKIVDYVSFGSEIGELKDLYPIAHILVEEPPIYNQLLKKHLQRGESFPVARSRALEEYFTKYNKNHYNLDINKIIKSPNNILAIEYLKALKKLNSNIKPVTIKRFGSQYNDVELKNKIASATAIRKKILEENELSSVKDYLPQETYDNLESYINQYHFFNSLDNYNQIIHYLLRIEGNEKLSRIMDVEAGLDNRIVEKSGEFNDIESFVSSIVTKRYPRSRIQRILVHLMMNLYKENFIDLYLHHPAYIRVLGSNKKGFYLINKIKKKTDIPIIIKFSDHHNLKNPNIDRIISFDKKSTDLFFLGLNTRKPLTNMDYYTSPYIKK